MCRCAKLLLPPCIAIALSKFSVPHCDIDGGDIDGGGIDGGDIDGGMWPRNHHNKAALLALVIGVAVQLATSCKQGTTEPHTHSVPPVVIAQATGVAVATATSARAR